MDNYLQKKLKFRRFYQDKAELLLKKLRKIKIVLTLWMFYGRLWKLRKANIDIKQSVHSHLRTKVLRRVNTV